MKELMVVAIGGNSIIKDNASQSVEHQAQAVKAVAESVLEMLASDYDIVLTHGNGPQVGLDLRRAEIAHEREGLPLTPLANCVADTQGGIGYLIQQALNNRLSARGEQKAVTVVTQVEVDKNDPGFSHPTKPIGAFFSEAQRDELQQAHPDWHLAGFKHPLTGETVTELQLLPQRDGVDGFYLALLARTAPAVETTKATDTAAPETAGAAE